MIKQLVGRTCTLKAKYNSTGLRCLSTQGAAVRPDTPHIWHRFSPKRELDGECRNYRVQDLTNDTFDKAIHLLINHFIPDEPLCRIAGMPNDKKAKEEMSEYWFNYLKQNTSLACYEETKQGKDKLVGINVTWLCNKSDPKKDPLEGITSPSWRKVRKTLLMIMDTCNVYEKYQVDQYMGGSGLVVLPEYRGQNIGAEIMNTRKQLCECLGLKATATVFSAKPSQVLAYKCGYEVLGSIDLTKSEKLKNENIEYPGLDTPIALWMGMPNDKKAKEEMSEYWFNYLKQNTSLACYEETKQGKDKLVGINVTWLCNKSDPKKDPLEGITSPSWRKVRKTLLMIMDTCNVYEKYQVDQYMGGSGLVVLPEYRGQNIGAEIMNTRKQLCECLGLKATATVFSAKPSQVLAYKCGYEVLGSIDLTKSEKLKNENIEYPGLDTPIALWMGKKF